MQINASIPSLDFNPSLKHIQDKPESPEVEVQKKETTEQKVEKNENIDKLKNVLAEHNISMKFSQDVETKEVVVELVDDKTGESIRQIPSTISLKLAALFIKLQGQFVDTQE